MITLLLLSALLLRADAADTTFVEEKAAGSFHGATRLLTTPQGWIYILDVEQNLVAMSKNGGDPFTTMGGYGWSSTTFDQPTGLATDGLNVYVADRGNHRLMRFDRSLNFISSFTTRDTSFLSARFGSPLGVALSRFGDLFVLDGENLRVIKFGATMQYERSFGGIDDARARIRQPLKILISSGDHVFVLEPERVLEFDYFGQFVREIGTGRIHDARSLCLVRDGLIVATAGSLMWFNDRSELAREFQSRDILAGSSVEPIEDLTVENGQLLLLTSTRLHFVRIEVTSK